MLTPVLSGFIVPAAHDWQALFVAFEEYLPFGQGQLKGLPVSEEQLVEAGCWHAQVPGPALVHAVFELPEAKVPVKHVRQLSLPTSLWY